MKVTNEHVGRLLEARLERIQRAVGPRRAETPESQRADRATFSSRAEDLRIALERARQAPASDEARLESLASRVRAGKYQVPAEDLAEVVLRDLRGPGAR